MAAEKRIGHGATWKMGSTVIGQVRLITPPALTREDVDATTLDDGVKYNIPSDPEDPGEATIEQLWTSGNTNDELVDTDFNARTIAAHSITYPLSTPRIATFNGWIKSITPGSLQGTDPIMRTIVVRLTTVITWS